MTILRRGGRYALLVIMLSVVLTGCAPRAGATNAGWTVVTVIDDIVLSALANDTVVGLKTSTGELLWTYPVAVERPTGLGGLLSGAANTENTEVPLDAMYGAPELAGDTVLIGSFNQRLYAFDGASGRKLWEFAAEGPIIGGATAVDGRAYFGSSDHRVYAVDIATGKSVWDAPFETGNWVWSTPAVDGKYVYIGSMDHTVYALDRQTGALVWQRDLGASIPGAVCVADGQVYVGSIAKRLHVLNANTGDEVWQRDLGQWVWGEPLVHEGYVYVPSLDGKVHALATGDGSPRWEPVQLNGAVRAGAALMDDHLIVGTDTGRVYRIAISDGSAQLIAEVQGRILSRPSISGDRVYVGTTLASVVALDVTRADGGPIWIYPPPKQ